MTLSRIAVSRRVQGALVVLIAAMVSVSVISPIGLHNAQAGNTTAESVVTVAADGRFSTGDRSILFGNPGDQPLMGDWNCDGVDTPGVYRARIARAFFTNSTQGGGTNASLYFGNPGDIALAGDFNGDGCDTIAVYRSATSTFYIRNSLTSGAANQAVMFGNPGDQPLVGDFDGDGRDTFGVYRSTGWVYFKNDFGPTTTTTSFPFGNPGDRAVAEDLDGDGKDVVAVYRPSQGRIYIARTADSIAVGKYRVVIAAVVNPEQWPETPEQVTPAPEVRTPSSAPTNYDIDVDLWPGDNLGSIVSNAPQGTVFRINGAHSNQAIKPRDGQVFVGAPGAVLRGGGTERAFSSSAKNVVIDGLEITDYQSAKQDGAIQASGSGWVIRNNEIHHNATVGVKIYKANSATIESNSIHHNGQLGVSVAYSNASTVTENEIAFNNWQVAYSWGWEAGGTKFWSTDGLVVRDNWSHDNHGPGLWSDHDNINILYEGNLVEDNHANGIFHEIGYGGVIRNNVIRRNGFGHDSWLWGAGILIAASQNVDIYGNEVTGNFNGITLVQQDRGSGAYGPYIVQNNRVHDNRIVNSGISGAARDISSQAVFTANNTFTGNDYVGSSRWEWENRRVSWETWRSYGHDADGSYSG
jgi:parallel beta-helix repeat protein